MLTHLYIKNFALIDELNMDFCSGFSVITGETGAGKSIILGALGQLLGNRADIKQIKPNEQKCIIEAEFDITNYNLEEVFAQEDIDYDANCCILRREITANGKSRSFINDQPAPLTSMKSIGNMLIDIHSQHQNLLLQNDDFQLSVLDIIADNAKLLAEYKDAFHQYGNAAKRFEQMKEELERNRDNADYMRFQYNELSMLNVQPDELQQLEAQSNLMQHAEDAKSALYEADCALTDDNSGILTQLHLAMQRIQSISSLMPQMADLDERLNVCKIELKDIESEIASALDSIDYDADELVKINSRIDSINMMLQKHHVQDVNQLIELRQQLALQLHSIDNSDEDIKACEQECHKLRQAAQKLADKLTAARSKSAKAVEKELCKRLMPLGLPNVRFEVELQNKSLTAEGQDRASFLFSANPGLPLRPVNEIASGGEIARVMLALKAMISGVVKLPTIIFDEIDTGVSGRVAEQMAIIMQQMGQQERQVISITHLPQIAAYGKEHYRVAKTQTNNETKTILSHLTIEERVQEIAQMLSGTNITEAAMTNARQLLKMS